MPETALINNWLFAAMSQADQDVLAPLMTRRDVAAGEVLAFSSHPITHVHFPASAQIANLMMLDTGQSLAVNMVGREGVTGLTAFMANEPIGWDIVAHIGGVVWTVPAAVLRSQACRSPDLFALLMKAAHCNQLEAHVNAICATFHPVTARVARYLLTMQERTGLSDFNLTQDALARLLGTQRTTIVTTMGELSRQGAIAGKMRGRVSVRDRSALKAAVCGCLRRTPEFARSPLQTP